MEKNKIIGKEVWVLQERNSGWFPNKEKVWKVKEYIDWGDARLNGDYCPHLILEDSLGNTKDIREWEVIVTPDTSLPEVDMLNRYASDNRLYLDDISSFGGKIRVSISWGDWKHDHGFCNRLLSYIGYSFVKEEVTEEDGSDCYSADHYFVKH